MRPVPPPGKGLTASGDRVPDPPGVSGLDRAAGRLHVDAQVVRRAEDLLAGQVQLVGQFVHTGIARRSRLHSCPLWECSECDGQRARGTTGLGRSRWDNKIPKITLV